MSQLVKKVAIAAATGPKALGAYSPAILVEGNKKTLFVSGQLGLQVTSLNLGKMLMVFECWCRQMGSWSREWKSRPGRRWSTWATSSRSAWSIWSTYFNMGHLLKAAGCDHRHVVKTTVLLKDIKDFPVVNAVYAEFFREDPPARATFQVTFPHLYQTFFF